MLSMYNINININNTIQISSLCDRDISFAGSAFCGSWQSCEYLLKTLLMNQLICCLGIIHERQSKSWQSCTKRVKNIEKMH